MKIIIILIASILLIPSNAIAGDGKNLLIGCKKVAESLDYSFLQDMFYDRRISLCVGKVIGVRETITYAKLKHPNINICTPAKLLHVEVIDSLVTFFEKHPEILHLTDIALIYKGLEALYPCNK